MANDIRMSSLVELVAESISAEHVPQVQQISTVQSGPSMPASEKSEPSTQSSDTDTTSTSATSSSTLAARAPDKNVNSKLDNSPTVNWEFETTPPEPITLPGLGDAPKSRPNPERQGITYVSNVDDVAMEDDRSGGGYTSIRCARGSPSYLVRRCIPHLDMTVKTQTFWGSLGRCL
jgi:hypothetical protein